jgi:co-chaperonin GroES (HSP10)
MGVHSPVDRLFSHDGVESSESGIVLAKNKVKRGEKRIVVVVAAAAAMRQKWRLKRAVKLKWLQNE